MMYYFLETVSTLLGSVYGELNEEETLFQECGQGGARTPPPP
jgi:hypothetical protein